jgi:hypothetical protein
MPGWARGQERWSERSQPCPTTPRGMPGTVRSGLEIRSDGDGRIGCWLSGPAGLSPDPRAARSGVSARPPGGGGVLEWSDSEPGDGCVLRGFPAGSHRWLTVLPEFRSLPSLTCQTSSISMLERQPDVSSNLCRQFHLEGCLSKLPWPWIWNCGKLLCRTRWGRRLIGWRRAMMREKFVPAAIRFFTAMGLNTEQQQRELTRVYQNALFQTQLMGRIARLSPAEEARQFEARGFEHFETERAQNKPVILAGSHLGVNRLLPLWLALGTSGGGGLFAERTGPVGADGGRETGHPPIGRIAVNFPGSSHDAGIAASQVGGRMSSDGRQAASCCGECLPGAHVSWAREGMSPGAGQFVADERVRHSAVLSNHS